MLHIIKNKFLDIINNSVKNKYWNMSLEKYKKVIDEDFCKDIDFINKTINNFSLQKDSNILDIGTGLGAMSILLALNGFNVLTGQPEKDPEWDKCEKEHCNNNDEYEEHHHEYFSSDWRENARKLGVENKITFQNLNAEQLFFPDNSFDAIFMYDSLQHIKKRNIALKECIRILKENGLIFIIEWNKRSIKDDEQKYGFKIDYVDPRQILKGDNLVINLIKGEYVNIFIIRKN